MKFSKRHFAKSLSWRLIGTVDTFVFVWLITGELNEGLSISGITTFTKLVWYYFHEHFWFKSYVTDNNKRHIIKTFSWRGVGTLDTILFGWLITGNPFTGLKIGGIETASKMLLYFAHEKLWYKINFGLDRRKMSKQFKSHQVERNATKK